MDSRQKQQLLTVLLFFLLSLFLYSYMYTILYIATVLFSFWLAHEYLQDHHVQTVDAEGKRVFITGCDSGFGLASAKKFHDLGFDVIAGCFNDNSDGARELRDRKVRVLALDVTSDDSVTGCAAMMAEVCGDAGLWAVVNNCGVNNMGPVEVITMEAYRRTAEVNLWGAVRVTKALLPLIRRAKGRVVNVTSERAFNPWPLSSSYCVSKFGLEAFSACLRGEMHRFGVQVITVAPGNFSGASSITNTAANAALRESLVQGRSLLSQEDQQKSYPVEVIDQMLNNVVEDIPKSCNSPDPVVDAYVDAVNNVRPRRCYMVTGMRRRYADPTIVCARLRPFLPERLMALAVRAVMFVLNRNFSA